MATNKQVYVFSLASDGAKALSTNFKVKEFACKDGSDPIFVHPDLVDLLQKIRTHFGKAVVINSAYRNPSHNKSVGGSTLSQHMYGMAADIVVSGVTPKEVYTYADSLMPNKGGVGLYPTFTHVDVRDTKARF